MWILEALGIALIFALIFVVYYLKKSIKLLKGETGWKLLSIGFSLYALRVVLSYFMDFPVILSGVEVARLSLSAAIIFFISLGIWKLSNDLKKVNISFLSLVYAKYLILGLILFIATISWRTSSYFFTQLNALPWWIAARTVLLVSILMFGLALRRIYLILGPKTAEIKAVMNAVEMKWLRENLYIVPLYTQLANRIIAHLLPVTGGVDIANRALERCAAMHGILKGNKITEEGLNADTIFKNAEIMEEKERAAELFDAFSCLNSRLIDAYAAITSPERAMEVMHDSEEVIEHMRKINLPVDNELLYKHRIFFGMPEGVAVNGKSKTFLYIVLKEALEPLLMKCSPATISEVSKLAATKNIAIQKDGKISLDAIFKQVHEISPEESAKFSSSVFSTLMEDFYPLIRSELGAEHTKAKFSAVFTELFTHHCSVISKYDVLETLPEEIEIPELCKLFERGQSYLIKEEKPHVSFKLFNKLIEYGFKGLLISRTHPSHVRSEYDVKDVPVIWLTHVRGENHIVPTNITQLNIAVKDFSEKGIEGVIMLEGLEYIIDQNGFVVALRFVESITDILTISRCRLIIPFDERTLSEKELHRLERELNVMSGEEAKEFNF